VIRVAFVKYAGLSAGGTERWLQTIANGLPRDRFAVTYFYCEPVPGTSVPGTDPYRKRVLEDAGVELVEFHVGSLENDSLKTWADTDFWELFNDKQFDLVQTAKEGLPEYPFGALGVPVFEQVAYNAGVDHSPGIVRSGHWSQWQRTWWTQRGGDISKSFVTPLPVRRPHTDLTLRAELGIDDDAVVVGFHQRVDDKIFSPVQLQAIRSLHRADITVLVLGGSIRYRRQAEELGLERFHSLAHTGDDTYISRFLNTLDIYTHGRRDGETFGSVLAEAMMHGVPCVSHRAPGGGNAQVETIAGGGFVATTAEEYGHRLRWLVDERGERRRLGDNGRQHALARYGVALAVSQMAAEYEAFAHGNPPPAPPLRPYGEAPEGFLIAGPIVDPRDPSFAVVNGRSIRPVSTRLVASVASQFADVVEVGADQAYEGFVAVARAHRSLTVVESQEGTCHALTDTLRYNDWTGVVRVAHGPNCPFRTCTAEEVLAAPQTPALLIVHGESVPHAIRALIERRGVAMALIDKPELVPGLKAALRVAGYDTFSWRDAPLVAVTPGGPFSATSLRAMVLAAAAHDRVDAAVREVRRNGRPALSAIRRLVGGGRR
jgi:glycosyltransferase involved in cell wall biosynthesis